MTVAKLRHGVLIIPDHARERGMFSSYTTP